MMERKAFLGAALPAIVILASLALAGCFSSDSGGGPTLPKWSAVNENKASISGNVGNPEMTAGAGTYVANVSANATAKKFPCGLVATLTWTDDHKGTDSQDTEDKFTLTLGSNGSTVSGDSMKGNLVVAMGYTPGFTGSSPANTSTNSSNSTNSSGSGSGSMPKALGSSMTVTVKISDCGTYGIRPNAIFVRYYDPGNDFTLDITVFYVEIAG